jgi:hypothetical protein
LAEPWYDDKIFKISDFNFTIGDAVLVTTLIIVFSSIGFAISSYIAYRKRKAIAAGARRMSQSIKRASFKLHASIMGRSNRVGDENDVSDDGGFGILAKKDDIVA